MMNARAAHPYNTEAYAKATSRDGRYAFLNSLQCWVTIRPIAGSPLHDAAGLYPFSPSMAMCKLSEVQTELRQLGAVSFVTKTNALADQTLFHGDRFDWVRPYKPHYIVSNSQPGRGVFTKHHRAEIRRAFRRCEVAEMRISDVASDWSRLVQSLAARHELQSSQTFDDRHVAPLADIPGFTAIAAFRDNRMISCHIWAEDEDRAYSHLAASDADGYRHGASFAVYAQAIEKFHNKLAIDLGGVPDGGKRAAGLAKFKSGFANDERPASLVGIIADQEAYDRLSHFAVSGEERNDYFPLYRMPR